ncbi:hypothetical protein GCM10011584_09390 [Nocardioides phosphati]|uniref:Phage gp6-like head-tail connector protein n=1 Tax=Nocardioides phosphati TaxID=1867775 RepID=A0ABQ2N7V9_9ACTN|nr:hypothetical protein [Nocardioides phosphati]GGO86625.1 hypothetical protein GCM10011584_09390 [Nocardioides phosphati]
MTSVLSLSDAKLHLNISVDTWNAEIEAFIAAAEAALEERVGPLQPRSRTDRVRGGGPALALYASPAISLTSVTEVGGVALTVADLSLHTSAGVVRFVHGGTFTGREYDVAYTAGRGTCPDDLMLAVKELVRHLWQSSQRGNGQRGGSAEVVPGAAYMFPNRVLELISPHLSVGF